MNQNFSHTVKASTITVLDFPHWIVKGNPEVQIHAAGCAHSSKADSVIIAPTDAAQYVSEVLADDWFYVAPCARKAA